MSESPYDVERVVALTGADEGKREGRAMELSLARDRRSRAPDELVAVRDRLSVVLVEDILDAPRTASFICASDTAVWPFVVSRPGQNAGIEWFKLACAQLLNAPL